MAGIPSPLRVMIAEDERLAREELIYLLSREQGIQLLPSATNGVEAVELAAKHSPDVMFLDIEMPEMDGIQTAHRMMAEFSGQVMLVFTTAYDQHAVEAFSLEAVDYLLKPFDEERLKLTLERLRKRKAQSQAAAVTDGGNEVRQLDGTVPKRQNAPETADTGIQGKLNKLLVDDGSRMIVIDPALILYAMKDEKVSRIHMADGRELATKLTLQELEDRLGPEFYRPHRSYLINLHSIQEIEPWFNGAYNAILKDSKRTVIPVSRAAARELLRALQGAR